MEHGNPLQVSCKNCGAPAGFDILRQTYACPSCGELTGIQEVKKAAVRWRTLQKQDHGVDTQGLAPEEYACPSCGARIVFKRGEASETCQFCGSPLIRKELDQVWIIPFFITPEEARERMLQWGHDHEDTPEGKAVLSNMGSFQGCYLPYDLIRGPVYGTVTRDGNSRAYRCAGYLEGSAVNLSREMDHLVLDEIEPFDWSAARPFEYGYIAGHPVKLPDISEADTDLRVQEKAEKDFLPEVEKVMQSSGVSVQAETGELSAVPALLPVYFIRTGRMTAAMNGQTGRIAVSRNRKKKTTPWVIEPLIYTLLATVLAAIPYRFELEALFLFGFVFGALFFTILGEGRHSLIRTVTLRSESARARREQGELRIEEGKDILKNPYGNTPVFYEKDGRCQDVPVKIRFYTPARILSILLNAAVTLLLPLLIAVAVRFVESEDTTANFLEGIDPMGGAGWYLFAGALLIVYLAKGVRRDVYDHPILYDASGKKLGKRASRKLSVLSVLVPREPEEKTLTAVFRTLRMMGGLGIFVGVVIAALFFGSIAMILR